MRHQRQWKYLFMVWGMGCIMACNGDETAVFDALAKIEAQGDTAATVALQRLEQMKQTVDEQQDEHLTNKYKLLGIRLRDKAYITHTSSDRPWGWWSILKRMAHKRKSWRHTIIWPVCAGT